MTPKQHELLTFIVASQRKNGFTPTYGEMAAHLGLSSKSGVHRLIYGLQAGGYILLRKGTARSITVVRAATATPHCPHCGGILT